MKKIKIVIWDMDDTFWKGTLSEGDVTPIPQNIQIIKSLIDKGIMNSISSKNNYENVKRILTEMGVWDYFIFPVINWEPKGQQIHQLLEDCSLREENALFIDDNEINLQEVKFYNPGINVYKANVSNDSLIELLSSLKGNDDISHSRLNQYKILETKKEASSSFSSNEDFLYASNIRAYIRYDCDNHYERLLDLINRSNQLNYTKIRLNNYEFSELLSDNNTTNGYVQVEDDFGEYGIVGFFSIRDQKLIHFLFSCRTIGMGIEQYVYSSLNYPEIDIVGDVRSELSRTECPQWINQYKRTTKKDSKSEILSNKIKVLISGGCDLEQLAAYMKATNCTIDYRFNVGKVRHDSTTLWVGSKQYSKEEKESLISQFSFIDNISFDESIYDSQYNVVVLSILMDYTQAIYQNKENKHIIISHGDYNKPISDSYKPEYLSSSEIDCLLNRYVYTGGISPENFYSNLEYIRGNMSPKTTLILINGCEIPVSHEFEIDRYRRHHEFNEVLDRFVSNHNNTTLLDMRKIITSREQLTDNIRHYQRNVYYDMARELTAILNRTCEGDIVTDEHPSFIKRILRHVKKRIYR